MSTTWQCCAKRSTKATTQAAPGKTVPHCEGLGAYAAGRARSDTGHSRSTFACDPVGSQEASHLAQLSTKTGSRTRDGRPRDGRVECTRRGPFPGDASRRRRGLGRLNPR